MQGNKVLVVDDDPDVVEYLSSFLEDNGYEVAAASDGASAREAVARFRPDAVLIDVLMPGRSGLDLLVSLRNDPRWCDIPLVVVTGSDQILEDDCQSYMGSHHGVRGPDGVLGKPIDRKTLLAVLKVLPDASASRV
jgi:CheY-like chemotaxis protein